MPQHVPRYVPRRLRQDSSSSASATLSHPHPDGSPLSPHPDGSQTAQTSQINSVSAPSSTESVFHHLVRARHMPSFILESPAWGQALILLECLMTVRSSSTQLFIELCHKIGVKMSRGSSSAEKSGPSSSSAFSKMRRSKQKSKLMFTPGELNSCCRARTVMLRAPL